MILAANQVVKLRNGIYGVVAAFNEKPFQLIFRAYSNPIGRYDQETLKNKNAAYDIVEVRDGSTLENVTDAFKAKFNGDELPLVWSAPEDEEKK